MEFERFRTNKAALVQFQKSRLSNQVLFLARLLFPVSRMSIFAQYCLNSECIENVQIVTSSLKVKTYEITDLQYFIKAEKWSKYLKLNMGQNHKVKFWLVKESFAADVFWGLQVHPYPTWRHKQEGLEVIVSLLWRHVFCNWPTWHQYKEWSTCAWENAIIRHRFDELQSLLRRHAVNEVIQKAAFQWAH